MPRRRRTSPAEDLMSVASLLPWWLCMLLAVVAYFVLHRLGTPPVLGALKPGDMNRVILGGLGYGLASVGQYFVPLLLLGGAITSYLGRRKRASLVADVGQSKAADALDGMSWQDFELLVGEGFRLQGYTVAETGGGGADGGVDLMLRKGTEKFLVQCKQWKAFKVGVQPVRELYGVMAARGAAGGFVVTSGRFTQDAVDFASGRNVTLVDGPKLRGLIQQAKASRTTTRAPSRSTSRTPAAAPAVEPVVVRVAEEPTVPACPACSRPMVLRTAKKGANAGATFWGCSGYSTGCRGTRPA